MTINEPRVFDAALWLVCLSVLLALLTGCSAAIPAPVTPTADEQPTRENLPAATQQSQDATVSPSPSCTVQTGIPRGYLNLRTGAGVSHAVLRVLEEGETLIIIRRGAWLEVTDREGAHGYVNARYCK